MCWMWPAGRTSRTRKSCAAPTERRYGGGRGGPCTGTSGSGVSVEKDKPKLEELWDMRIREERVAPRAGNEVLCFSVTSEGPSHATHTKRARRRAFNKGKLLVLSSACFFSFLLLLSANLFFPTGLDTGERRLFGIFLFSHSPRLCNSDPSLLLLLQIEKQCQNKGKCITTYCQNSKRKQEKYCLVCLCTQF